MTSTNRPLGRTARFHGWRFGIILCAALLVTAIGATNASAAKTICLGTTQPASCDGNTVANLTAAVQAVDASQVNTIYIGSGNYPTASGADFGAADVRLIGVGGSPAVLTMYSPTPAANALNMLNPNSKVSRIWVELPSGSAGLTGIRGVGGQALADVTVTGSGVTGAIGIDLSGGRQLIERASVSLSGSGNTGVRLRAAHGVDARDITVEGAGSSVEVDDVTEFELVHVRAIAGGGVSLRDSSGVISSSVIEPGPGKTGVTVDVSDGTAQVVQVDNCTLVGGEAGSIGVDAAATQPDSQVEVAVGSSIVHGFATAARSQSSLGGASHVGLDYSAYDGALAGVTSAGPGNRPGTQNYGFADARYRLALTSPMVDAGSPVANPAASATDADGASRVVSRGAGMIRDIGAYELQNQAPVASVRVVTAAPSTTSPTAFTAAGSTDAEGDAMTFDWTFDGLPVIGGITATKQFPMPGLHTVRLTVTDRAGAVSIASQQFMVAKGSLPVRLRSQDARLSRRGTFKITLSCPAAAISNCEGRMIFRTARPIRGKRYLTAAHYVFTVRAGTTQKVTVPTYRTFRNVLAAKKKFQLVGMLDSATTQNALLAANRAIFTIRAPR